MASPLKIDFSDEEFEDEDYFYSKKNPRRSKRNLQNSEPKLRLEEPLHPIETSNKKMSRKLRIFSEKEPPGSAPSHLGNANIQSTPKTTAAQRFQSRYFANLTPSFSPKKRLDFESFVGNDDESDLPSSSPKSRGKFSSNGNDHRKNHDDHDLMMINHPPACSSSSVMPRTPPRTPNSSRTNSSYHLGQDLDDLNTSGRSTIKPVSLASKFDCFSDSD